MKERESEEDTYDFVAEDGVWKYDQWLELEHVLFRAGTARRSGRQAERQKRQARKQTGNQAGRQAGRQASKGRE